jgi:peptidoglycan/LPS O-acetylase OafA/YrhL
LSGVLLALVLGWDRNRPGLTRWLRWLQWPLYLAIGWVMTRPHLGHGTPWHRTWDFAWVWLCGLGVVIVAILGNGWLRATLSYSRMVWLGKISYGLYMYHEIALWVRKGLSDRLPWFANKDEILAIATLALTIGLAAASYYGYERRFLELKRAWTRVPSRPV